MINEIAICLISSQEVCSFLLIDIKSLPKKIPSTPLTDNKFLIKWFVVSSLFVISYEPLLETTLPGKNFNELGFGVV